MFLEIYINYAILGSLKALPSFSVCQKNGYLTVGNKNQGLFVMIKKRAAYPGTYCNVVNNIIILGYGDKEVDTSKEFLRIDITKVGDLQIRRDIFVTLPIFYKYSNSEFIASNDYSCVASKCDKSTINNSHILETLVPNPDRHQTLLDQVQILDERHNLLIKNQSLSVINPPSRAWGTTREFKKQDSRKFAQLFSNSLYSFYERCLEGQNFAFEVSGGIDSSALPIYLAKVKNIVVAYIGSMIFPGDFRESQINKLSDIAGVTNFKQIAISIKLQEDYPLARLFSTKISKQFYTFEEIYSEALIKLADAMQSKGIEVVATGIGGDELFENVVSLEREYRFGDEEIIRRKGMQYAPFLTDQFISDYISSTPKHMPYPLPYLSISSYGAQLARNNIYIDRDIWPVSPFSDIELYNYCQGLPVVFRANKNILRAYFEANGFPKSVYNTSQNEHFGLFFNESLCSDIYSSLIKAYATNSWVAKLGYINTSELLTTYQRARCGEKIPQPALFNIFTWLGLEINTDIIRNKSI